VRFKKNLQKSTLAFKGGELKLRKPSILMVPEFHTLFLFLFFLSGSAAAAAT
jgi:hypothetical protein